MIKVPRPFAIAIDDMGWMSGRNEGYLGKGPFRLGVNREMCLDDYQAVVSLAIKAGVRLQGLFVLGELDRDGVAVQTPTAMAPGLMSGVEKSRLQLDMMEFVKKNAAHLEFGLHGVGHEYWPDNSGYFKRAEWYNLDDKRPWPEASIKNHLDCFVKIMAQYDLTVSNHQSFPQSFVPCAYSYYWNPFPKSDEYSLGKVLSEYGVLFANTNFTFIPECNPPIDGGFDQGVHVLNRFNYGNLWHMVGQLPTIPIEYQNTDFIETHWPNLLAQDAFLQEDLTCKWSNYFSEVNNHKERYCSKNTAQHHSQFLYRKYTILTQKNQLVLIDNSQMPTTGGYDKILGNLVLKIPITNNLHVGQIKLDGNPIPGYFEIGKYAYLFLPKLSSRTYELTYHMQPTLPEDIVWHDSTCNILELFQNEDFVEIIVRFYGCQKIIFLTKKTIETVDSSNPLLKIHNWNRTTNGIEIKCAAKDIQGVTGSLRLGLAQ